MASTAMNKAVGEVEKVIKIGLKAVGKETKEVLQGKIGPKKAVAKVIEDVDSEATKTITEDTLNSVFPSESPFSKKSDKEGVELGDFITSNAKVALRLKDAQAKLKEKVGACPEIDIIFFKNWAKTVKGLLLHVSPVRVEQVQTIVRAAAELNIKVGCGGAYSSWSPIFPDGSDGQQSLIINTYDLALEDGATRIRLNEDAQGTKTVTIASGVTTAELKQFLLDNDICLRTSIMAQSLTYGGILSTASHGTGKDNPIPSDWITSLKLVDGNGEIRTYPDDIPAELPEGISQEDAMNALRASLGVFGIIVEFTLKVEESFSVRVNNTYPTISQLFYGPHPRLEEVVKDNWAVEIHWFPFSSLGTIGGLVQALPVLNVWNPKADEVWLRTMNPVKEEAPINKWQVFVTQVKDTLEGRALNATRGVVVQHSFLVPAVIGSVLDRIKSSNPETSIERLPYAIHYRFGVKFTPLYDLEFAFPCDLDDLSPVYKALDVVLKKTELKAIQDLGLHKKYPLSIGIELRVFGKSSCLLSPSAPGDKSHTACIDLIGLAGVPAHQQFFDEVAQEWMKLGGIPHWAKRWIFIPGIMDHIRDAYGDNLVKFAKVRKALGVDKQDMFLNKTMREVLPQV